VRVDDMAGNGRLRVLNPTELDLHAQLLLLVQVMRRWLHPGSAVLLSLRCFGFTFWILDGSNGLLQASSVVLPRTTPHDAERGSDGAGGFRRVAVCRRGRPAAKRAEEQHK